jgi:hypothetical protein
MPDPKKPWEKNYSEDIAETKVEAKKPWEQDYVSDSEKKNSIATSTPPKSVSVTSTGSSGGKGFPKIDTNSVAPGLGVQPKVSVAKIENKNTVVNYEKPKDTSFFDYLKENLDTGLATVSKSIYDTPGLVYDAAASITNPIFRAVGVSKDKLASSDKLADDLGFKNIPSEVLQEKIRISNEKINAYSAKNGGDALKAVQDGNYVGAAKLVAGTTMQSLPIMIAAMASGGETTALSAIGLSTASTKNAQLKQENPEMGLGTRVLNAANSGIIEAVTGHLFTGASGAVMRKILAEKGVEQGSKIISKSLKSTIEKSIEKNPLISAVGEVVEESAVEFGNQLNDMSSGIRTEFDIHAIKNAGLSATGMGGLQTLGVYGAKGYVKTKTYAKVKATNKEVFKLRNEIENGNLSDENKTVLGLRADRLEAENKKLLGTEIEKVKALPSDVKTELNALNAEFESLKSKFDDIDDADDIPDNLKPAMKEEIKIQATQNQKRKAEILSQNDGLEVDNDFSNFNGVEPDFNLENGKISSLPLKEQDRLNDQALQELTGGDMTIEVTKEQVSNKANEIYENEQNSPTPTPEAQPQAEVQKPSEAEKVDESNNSQISNPNDNKGSGENITKTPDSNQIKPQEVSPIEDVVAPSVEQAQGVSTVVEDDVKPIGELGNGSNIYFETEKYRVNDLQNGKVVLNIGDENDIVPIANVEFDSVKEAVEVAKKLSEYRPNGLTKDYNIEGVIETLKNEVKDAGKENGNIVADGNVRPTTPNVGEVRATEQEIPTKESVPSSVDGGEVKGDAEISNLDHAKSQIDKGVLSWNGDMSIERIDLGISWADIRKGESDIKRGKENSVPAKRLIEALAEAKKAGGYNYKQGTGTESARARYFVSLDDVQRYSNEYQLTDAEQKEVDDSEYEAAREYDKNFNSLSEQEQIEILENYENSEDNSGTPSADSGQPQSENNVSKEKERGKREKPTTKEKIAEKVKLSDAKIDEKSEIVKAKMKAFMDMFPSADINPDDYHTNGLNMDAIIDMVAKAAKSIAKGGIVTSEHIKEAIKAYNMHFYDEVDPKAVEERISPKKEADNDYKSKSGKKSLLGRLIEGGNPDVITKAVKELGENYDVRNQQEANDEAMAFIDKVGASEALKAIKDGLITNSDVKMLIYDEALTRLKTEISDEIDNNPNDREALIKKFQEVSDDFDNAVRDAGQGIAILNYIYSKNQTLKYNLKKQIADWKRNDPNNEIPADIKAKYEELDQKLKDLEEKTKEAEVRAKKAEDELAIKNIQEDVERKNQEAKKNKSGLTPKELARKRELRNKFARANDVTGIPALLVDPEFREYLGLVFKTAKGDFSNFSNEILKELGKSARQHLPEMFKEAGGKGDVKVTDLQSITISEEGKIKIPAQLLRDYVEAGETDIDVIAQLIKDDIADEFPDADVRDIRDALTGYGKQVNPNKDEITAEVNKLKEYGRLLSAYDDVMNGQMPLKSGLVRPKSEQKARELRRNINRLAKELNLEPVDLEKQWANAIDKVKSQLKNQIEDLDKQISNGEKRKIERTSIKLDLEAEVLKAERDAKKQILDDLVGKPELTEEQKIQKAENSLEKSIKKIEEEIATNDIAFKEKPTPATSAKIEQLKTVKKALLASKKQLRQEAGLIEQQRLKTTKTRIKNQIEDLKTRLANKDFAKKVVTPIVADSELNTLRAEKEAIYEEYEKMKYLQELKNRTFAQKMTDAFLELGGLTRAIKASLDLGLVGIQLRGFTYGELWRNPKELGQKFVKLFGVIGSQEKTNKATALIIGHPLHSLAKKLDIGMTHPDLRNEVREEMASGSMLHFIWNLPMYLADNYGGQKYSQAKKTSIGDAFINSAKTQYNKLFQNYKLDIKQKEKFTVAEQWKNINVFEAVERGLTVYGNQLRFEEFVRGVERLKAEGKDEINHLEDYKLLASYIRTFSGRAKPAGFELNQKGLNLFFFSFKNAASVFQQLNPVYYLKQHVGSTEFKNGSYFKPTVANKMAMATMFKSVVSTSATMLFIMAAYNASKDDDDEEMTIEKDPRSSDFGKLKLGTFRYDSWGGYIPLITLYARLLTEETKNSDGKVIQLGEDRNGIQNRGDALVRFIVNKESPGFQMVHQYLASKIGEDKVTGEEVRQNAFGENLLESDAYSFYPIFMGSVKDAKEKDFEGVKAFLTAYSALGLGNVQDYEKAKNSPKDKFKESQAKIKEYNDKPKEVQDRIQANNRVVSLRQKVAELENYKRAKLTNTPYLVKGAVQPADLSSFDVDAANEAIAKLNAKIEEFKTKAGDQYKEPKE